MSVYFECRKYFRYGKYFKYEKYFKYQFRPLSEYGKLIKFQSTFSPTNSLKVSYKFFMLNS